MNAPQMSQRNWPEETGRTLDTPEVVDAEEEGRAVYSVSTPKVPRAIARVIWDLSPSCSASTGARAHATMGHLTRAEGLYRFPPPSPPHPPPLRTPSRPAFAFLLECPSIFPVLHSPRTMLL
jgi:hypothetical protein